MISDKDDLTRFTHLLAKISLARPLKVTLEDYKPVHSLSQRGLYFIWMSEIASHTGHSKDEMHEYFKDLLLPPRAVKLGSVEKLQTASIRKMNKTDMAEYMTQIETFVLNELGIMLSMSRVY